VAWAFDINDIVPTALIFFTVAAALGWIGNRFWPETRLTTLCSRWNPQGTATRTKLPAYSKKKIKNRLNLRRLAQTYLCWGISGPSN
jgi:hypothetical protein